MLLYWVLPLFTCTWHGVSLFQENKHRDVTLVRRHVEGNLRLEHQKHAWISMGVFVQRSYRSFPPFVSLSTHVSFTSPDQSLPSTFGVCKQNIRMKPKAIILCLCFDSAQHLPAWTERCIRNAFDTDSMFGERLVDNQTSTSLACLFLYLLALVVLLLVAILFLGLVAAVIPGFL